MASIKKRTGPNGTSYLITVSNGYDVYGKKLFKTKTFKPDPTKTELQNQKDLERIAYDFERQVTGGDYLDGETMTVKDFAEKWLTEYVDEKLSNQSQHGYRFYLENYIIPKLGHYKLAQLKPLQIQAFLNGLKKDGARIDGKQGGLSKGSIKKTHAVLSSMLRTAVKWQIIDRNPCNNVDIPGGTAPRQDNFFTPEQALIFLNALDETHTSTHRAHTRIDDTGKPYDVPEYTETHSVPLQFKVLFHLALYGGLRNGEILALRFSDIDFANCSVNISRAVSYVDRKTTIKEPKTKTSARTVVVPKHVIELIQKLQIEQIEKQWKYGTYWSNPDGYLFTNSKGGLMAYTTPNATMRKIIKRHNDFVAQNNELTEKQKAELTLPNVTFHGLRHTSATLLIAQAVDPRTVAARLGHSQTSTTLNIYAHALKSLDETASDALDEILQAK